MGVRVISQVESVEVGFAFGYHHETEFPVQVVGRDTFRFAGELDVIDTEPSRLVNEVPDDLLRDALVAAGLSTAVFLHDDDVVILCVGTSRFMAGNKECEGDEFSGGSMGRNVGDILSTDPRQEGVINDRIRIRGEFPVERLETGDMLR